ncbi:hypothetical protein GCM10025867_07390 [Frondihabitans sucicola]|uniref:FAD-binding domain-containing protein n=1 Tax=Frondihabitans sucicola TaxID=1268041 RepID=A0ABM8GJC2_9MICO|nr:FAD-dependent monooxygenase [Frondihabitans sucicola]BDZ48498.1 hypothetical protein GCM10025867_07390 [Frondihabitans sucicola]
MPTILITGAGIAGDTLAVLLGRSGWDVTVVEIAPALREGGQTVDLRGDSREVLERLGLLDAALGVLVPQRGIAWVDERERRLAAMPVEAFGGQGFVSRKSCCAPTWRDCFTKPRSMPAFSTASATPSTSCTTWGRASPSASVPAISRPSTSSSARTVRTPASGPCASAPKNSSVGRSASPTPGTR